MNTTHHEALAPAPAATPRAGRKRRIFVVEDHDFMRRTIVAALEREPSLAVCGVAVDAPAALAEIVLLKPDLVLTDLTLRTSSGLDLIKSLRGRGAAVPIVATTMFEVRANERQARAAGASGFVSKQEGPDALVHAVHAALGGNA